MTTKFCRKCKEIKPTSEFYIRKKTGYLVTPCKVCSIENSKERSKNGSNRTEVAKRAKTKWLEANRDKRNAWEREYVKRPEVAARRAPLHRANSRKRKARLRGAQGFHVLQEWLDLCAKYGNICIVPGCERTDLTEDHIKPLSKSGSDFIENIQPMCSKHNSEKATKEIDYR